MARIHVPNRDTLITILLILAGVLLAMTLFGAGAIWKGKGTRHNSSVERPATGRMAHSETLSSRPEQIIANAMICRVEICRVEICRVEDLP